MLTYIRVNSSIRQIKKNYAILCEAEFFKEESITSTDKRKTKQLGKGIQNNSLGICVYEITFVFCASIMDIRISQVSIVALAGIAVVENELLHAITVFTGTCGVPPAIVVAGASCVVSDAPRHGNTNSYVDLIP